MSIKTIIFDLGNVLVEYNWKRHLNRVNPDKKMAERIANAMYLSSNWNENDRGIRTDEETLQAFIAGAPEYEPQIRELFDTVGETVKVYDYAIPLVKELRERGYKVYALSNWPRRIYEQRGENLNVLNEMDGYILSYREHAVKPEPEIYRLILERYGIVPEEAVFLDDNAANVKAAEAFGIHGIVFTNLEESRPQLEALLEER